ncbi:MAG: ribosomal L7Ae/L30e/S12e/Gadd45 family protein [Clostridiales bacterium]
MIEELKTCKKAIGLKQSIKALENETAKKLYIANDAEEKIVKNIIEMAKSKNITVNYVDSKKLLGKLCGINVGAAVVSII